jgi:hypothetical protein
MPKTTFNWGKRSIEIQHRADYKGLSTVTWKEDGKSGSFKVPCWASIGWASCLQSIGADVGGFYGEQQAAERELERSKVCFDCCAHEGYRFVGQRGPTKMKLVRKPPYQERGVYLCQLCRKRSKWIDSGKRASGLDGPDSVVLLSPPRKKEAK